MKVRNQVERRIARIEDIPRNARFKIITSFMRYPKNNDSIAHAFSPYSDLACMLVDARHGARTFHRSRLICRTSGL